MSERKKGGPTVIKGPVKIGNVLVTGEICVGGRIIKGDQVKVNGREVTGSEADEVTAKAQVITQRAREMAEQTRGAAISAESKPLNYDDAPQEIISDDFVAGTMIVGGVAYKLDRSTIDQEGKYRYVKAKK